MPLETEPQIFLKYSQDSTMAQNCRLELIEEKQNF
jgi:hypothetical protein